MYKSIKLAAVLMGGGTPPEPPATDGYWKHYQTGVITPIPWDSPNITGTTWSRPSWYADASEVKIPTGMTNIADGGVSNSNNIRLLDIPSTVTQYGSTFLGDQPYIETVILRNPVPATSPNISFGSNIGYLGNFQGVYVPSGSITAYQTTPPWSAFAPVFKAIT